MGLWGMLLRHTVRVRRSPGVIAGFDLFLSSLAEGLEDLRHKDPKH